LASVFDPTTATSLPNDFCRQLATLLLDFFDPDLGIKLALAARKKPSDTTGATATEQHDQPMAESASVTTEAEENGKDDVDTFSATDKIGSKHIVANYDSYVRKKMQMTEAWASLHCTLSTSRNNATYKDIMKNYCSTLSKIPFSGYD
jgi:hypothetical protein